MSKFIKVLTVLCVLLTNGIAVTLAKEDIISNEKIVDVKKGEEGQFYIEYTFDSIKQAKSAVLTYKSEGKEVEQIQSVIKGNVCVFWLGADLEKVLNKATIQLTYETGEIETKEIQINKESKGQEVVEESKTEKDVESEQPISGETKTSSTPSEVSDYSAMQSSRAVENNIFNISTSDVMNGKYTVKATVSSNITISKVLFPTWTDYKGQDDLTWIQGSANGNQVVATVDLKDHNFENGNYITHIYVYDVAGNVISIAVPTKSVSISAPKIKDISTTNVSEGRYTITANVSSNATITRVLFPTWTENKGQDDIRWIEGKVSGNEISASIDLKDFNFSNGAYITHIYVYDNAGKVTSVEVPTKKVTIDSPKVSEITTSELIDGRYTVNATVSSGATITKVLFPTWTDYKGQDDLTWIEGKINGNKISATIYLRDHNNEKGNYITHIYVYDSTGKVTSVAVPTKKILTIEPKVSSISTTELSNGSYTINATVTSGATITRVLFPTWTDYKGQDDLNWIEGKIRGNKISATVKLKDHNNEKGNYITHIYVYDSLGNVTSVAVPIKKIAVAAPKVSGIITTELSNGQYSVNATVTSGATITRVLFPTWTDYKGQDDLNWIEGKISGNKISATVKLKDHNNEKGNYITHIYVYDSTGNVTSVAVPTQKIAILAPKVSSIATSNVVNGKYTVSASVSSSSVITKVLFPTWTEKNGQDDLFWVEGKASDGKVSATIDLNNHNYENGNYITHIYVYDAAGNVTSVAVPKKIVKVDSPQIGEIKTTNLGSGRVKIEATVFSRDRIEKVMLPTWSDKNGQDDVKWLQGTISNNIATFIVDFKDHNYETGKYITHIYLYNSTGKIVSKAVPVYNVSNDSDLLDEVRISDIREGNYTLSVSVKSKADVAFVNYPTWTEKNGQDDIVWKSVKVIDGKAEIVVNASDHDFESGKYNTHLYTISSNGATSYAGAREVSILAAKMPSGWTMINNEKYLFDKNGNVVPGANQLVIDISEHNGKIDWEEVKRSGVDGVILRCGYGWSDDLGEQRDKRFLENAKELERLGIPYGIYLFSYEDDAYGALREAEYTLQLIQGRTISLPIYYDLEYSEYAGDISSSTYVDMVHAYCQRIEQAGYDAGVYANLNYWTNKLYDSSLNRYTKWVAQYNSNDGSAGKCEYTGDYRMWQYTSVGRVSGINTNVDMNAMYK